MTRTRRYLMGLALGEPVAVRMTWLVIVAIAVAVALLARHHGAALP